MNYARSSVLHIRLGLIVVMNYLNFVCMYSVCWCVFLERHLTNWLMCFDVCIHIIYWLKAQYIADYNRISFFCATLNTIPKRCTYLFDAQSNDAICVCVCCNLHIYIYDVFGIYLKLLLRDLLKTRVYNYISIMCVCVLEVACGRCNTKKK